MYKNNKKNVCSLLLDSRLITRVRFDTYNMKIVNCNGYIQVYYYTNKKVRNNIKNLDIDNLKNNLTSPGKNTTNDKSISSEIEERNIIRTRLNCQRLAKANSKDWKSFITLTYAENMQDVLKAKTDLNFFVKNIKKVYKDFKYIAIPEFQKRGSIHFHLLTNLSSESILIYKQIDNKKYYHIKYWNKGFTKVDFLKNDIKKIIGYISKYMTKDCDNRLFNIKRYTSSQNLIKPIEEYIDTTSINNNYINKILKNKELIYSNTYLDNENNEVCFLEYMER